MRLHLRDKDRCDRCGREGADFTHLAWDCLPIRKYWTEVLGTLTQMTDTQIPDDPLTRLLGYIGALPMTMQRFISLALLLAKRRVACRWSRGRAPKFKDWLQDLIFCQDQLHTYTELLPPSSRPRDSWSPLQTYLLAQATTPNTEDTTRPDGECTRSSIPP